MLRIAASCEGVNERGLAAQQLAPLIQATSQNAHGTLFRGRRATRKPSPSGYYCPGRPPPPNGGYVRGFRTVRSRKKSVSAAHASANSGCVSNSCGTPAKVCSSDATPAPRSVCNRRRLLSGGTVTSANPWKITVGGNPALRYVRGLAARTAASSLPGGSSVSTLFFLQFDQRIEPHARGQLGIGRACRK